MTHGYKKQKASHDRTGREDAVFVNEQLNSGKVFLFNGRKINGKENATALKLMARVVAPEICMARAGPLKDNILYIHLIKMMTESFVAKMQADAEEKFMAIKGGALEKATAEIEEGCKKILLQMIHLVRLNYPFTPNQAPLAESFTLRRLGYGAITDEDKVSSKDTKVIDGVKILLRFKVTNELFTSHPQLGAISNAVALIFRTTLKDANVAVSSNGDIKVTLF